MVNNSQWFGIFRGYNFPLHEPWDIVTRPPKQKRMRKRRMTLTRAMRQANEAGVSVQSAIINADGSVTLIFGKPSSVHNETFNEWDTVQ
ncbi:hypothetical protein [Bradyrhizobium sp. DOA9]|uniref:hypothetical protein n=1 Tax=Bradyrhizobium sp. DOA9 TaxID=1126627 RepID=UPI00046832CD|nr:hypothetical protein [Bradyrhizobium sp. DOA9]